MNKIVSLRPKNMKNRDLLTEELSDVRNIDIPQFYGGMYCPAEISLMYPAGMLP